MSVRFTPSTSVRYFSIFGNAGIQCQEAEKEEYRRLLEFELPPLIDVIMS